ncbi:MAG: glycosyltransferase [Eubacteriales bacterium]
MVKVTVIVPVFNVEGYLYKCINSIVRQSLDEIELLLIDDGSTDGSLEIIKDFYRRYPNKVRFIHKENEGVSQARNLGIIESKGDYIAFVDADDWLEEETLEYMYLCALEKNADLVLCDAKVIDAYTGKITKMWKSGNLNEEAENIYRHKALVNTVLPAPWGKLYRKNLFIEHHITFPIGLRNQDLGTTPRLLIHCNTISKVNKAYYNYLYREDSAMRTYDNKILDVIENLKIVKKYYESMGLDKEFKEELEYLHIEHLLFRAVYRVKNIKDNTMRSALTKKIVSYLTKEYPAWISNKNLKDLTVKKRVYLKMVHYGYIHQVMNMFTIKRRVIGK